MGTRSLSLATVACVLAGGSVFAQTSQAPSAAAGTTGSMPAPFELPAACRSAGGAMPTSSGMMQNMQGTMGGMDDAHKGYMDAMMRMSPAMMQGLMAKDPDLAFACSMLAHHMGAIEMAKVVMKHGDNPEAKRIAEKTIKEQEQATSELKEWVQKHAKQ